MPYVAAFSFPRFTLLRFHERTSQLLILYEQFADTLRFCHTSCESSGTKFETRSTGTATSVRFTELAGASCKNGIPGRKIVMLIPALGRSFREPWPWTPLCELKSFHY